MREILQAELERATTTVSNNPQLKTYFGEEWIQSHLVISNRYEKHPIFWILVDERRCSRIRNNLDVLYTKCDKFPRIINKLKSSNDELNFHSTISEIEVLAYYYNKETDDYIVEYEPSIPNSDKKPDLKITINNTEYFLEILTVFEDETDRKLNSMLQEIRMFVDDFENNPFVISVGLGEGFNKNDVLPFIKCIDESIQENLDLSEQKYIEFKRNNTTIANVTIYGERRVNKGYVGYMNTYARCMDESGRIKHKILTKSEQLPDNSINIVIVHLSYITQDFINLEDAFAGQSCVMLDINTHESSAGRNPNGIVNHQKGKNISLIIGYTKENYSTHKYYLNLSANKLLEAGFVQEQF